MEKLLEKLDEVIFELENDPRIKKIKNLNERLKKEEKLKEELLTYQKYPTRELKERIIKEPFFVEYKESETEINLLILEINQILKEIEKY